MPRKARPTTRSGTPRRSHQLLSAPVLGAIEWVAGALLVAGLLSRPSALLLAAICIVAALTDGVARIPGGLGVLDWLSWFFYLTEVPLAVLLSWLALAGSGRFALDARWAERRLQGCGG